ncbi:uncharacterized protein DEA37_0006311 [Paragonimus westermani]|uniref:C2H2-type domain-containing protein n=1 Tax=Paragonimus westermani TaxID=34504 RepID=A0A5J4NJK9_9TREM|nr:uncharacterized protein DEA37_0006311 [Paragonimus westermani]
MCDTPSVTESMCFAAINLPQPSFPASNCVYCRRFGSRAQKCGHNPPLAAGRVAREIASPLHQLTEKGKKFVWSAKCHAAFNPLKDKLSSPPILALPDFSPPVGPPILDTDASDLAIGAVLSQKSVNGEVMIACASRRLDRRERRYCTTRRKIFHCLLVISTPAPVAVATSIKLRARQLVPSFSYSHVPQRPRNWIKRRMHQRRGPLVGTFDDISTVNSNVTHYIRTDRLPTSVRPHRLAPLKHRLARAKLGDTLELGIIRPSESPQATLLHIMLKKSGAACVPPPEIRIAGDTVNSCGDFCYLGSNLSTDLSVDRELRARVARASAAFGRVVRRVWKNHSLKVDTKLCVYRSMVLSILLYGSETWTLYQRNVSYLSRFHVQCLRRILGIRWSDMIPNTEVLRRAGTDGMEAMLMMNQLRLARSLKSGKRNPGGQKRRYQDVVQVSLSRCNIDFRCWKDLALNRTARRNTVRAGVRAFNEQLLRGRERKRAVRKGIIGAIGRGDVTIWRCDVCGRECAGRLGLVGHQRTHSTPSAKRRRVR